MCQMGLKTLEWAPLLAVKTSELCIMCRIVKPSSPIPSHKNKLSLNRARNSELIKLWSSRKLSWLWMHIRTVSLPKMDSRISLRDSLTNLPMKTLTQLSRLPTITMMARSISKSLSRLQPKRMKVTFE